MRDWAQHSYMNDIGPVSDEAKKTVCGVYMVPPPAVDATVVNTEATTPATPAATSPLRVVIKRSGWARGMGGSRLYNDITGKKCCIGFACLAAGATIEDIRNSSAVNPTAVNPDDVPLVDYHGVGPTGLAVIGRTAPKLLNHSIVGPAYVINDRVSAESELFVAGYSAAVYRTEAEREAALVEYGRTHLDIEFEFVD